MVVLDYGIFGYIIFGFMSFLMFSGVFIFFFKKR